MRKPKRYRFNPGTLSYEPETVSAARHLGRGALVIVLSLLVFVFYVLSSATWLDMDLPKTRMLKMRNAAWQSRFELLSRRMEACEASLEDMAMRDDQVYRVLFGLGEIPAALRESGIAGVNRYSALDEKNPGLGAEARELDRLLKKAVIQSRSFDEVEHVSTRAGEIAQRIPAICPLSTAEGNFRYTSSFGYRIDPVRGTRGDRHTGIDLACSPGTPVFAPGDGVVTMAQKYYGYGNFLVIDHGFGYQTRYGHLGGFNAKVGDRVKRGDCVAFSGNSGRSTGPHLHYEVLFRGTPVNPVGFFDMEMPVEDYMSVVREPESRPATSKKGGRSR